MSGDHLERLQALLAQLDKFDRSTATGHCLHTGSPNILGEILLVSVDCDHGHGIPVGAGGATGEDLREAVAELKQLRADREPRRVICPTCERPTRLTANGLIRYHGPHNRPCRGSGIAPEIGTDAAPQQPEPERSGT